MDHFKQNGAKFFWLQFLNSVHTISASLQCTYSIFQNHFLPSILVNRVRAQDTITFLRAMSPYTDFDFELVLTQSADTLSLILQNICRLTYHFSTIHWTLILSKKVISYGSKYSWWPWTFGDDSCQRSLCLMGHYNDVYLI